MLWNVYYSFVPYTVPCQIKIQFIFDETEKGICFIDGSSKNTFIWLGLRGFQFVTINKNQTTSNYSRYMQAIKN